MNKLITGLFLIFFALNASAVETREGLKFQVQIKDHVSKELRTYATDSFPYHLQKTALPDPVSCYTYKTDKGDWLDFHLMCGVKDLPSYAVRVSCSKMVANTKTATLHLYPKANHTHSISIQCEKK